jgi:hypothetical protein
VSDARHESQTCFSKLTEQSSLPCCSRTQVALCICKPCTSTFSPMPEHSLGVASLTICNRQDASYRGLLAGNLLRKLQVNAKGAGNSYHSHSMLLRQHNCRHVCVTT